MEPSPDMSVGRIQFDSSHHYYIGLEEINKLQTGSIFHFGQDHPVSALYRTIVAFKPIYILHLNKLHSGCGVNRQCPTDHCEYIENDEYTMFDLILFEIFSIVDCCQ